MNTLANELAILLNVSGAEIEISSNNTLITAQFTSYWFINKSVDTLLNVSSLSKFFLRNGVLLQQILLDNQTVYTLPGMWVSFFQQIPNDTECMQRQIFAILNEQEMDHHVLKAV